MDILHRQQNPIVLVKEEPLPSSFHHTELADAQREAGLSAERYHNLNLTPVEMWTEREVAQMKLVRDRVPVPDRSTEMSKVIPAEAIDKILAGQYDSKVGGFVAKTDDVSHLKNYGEVTETLRTDYWDTPFTEGKDSYGLIEFKIEKPEAVEIPYNERLGGSTKNGAPCTGNGFIACRNGEVVPEWYAPRELPQHDAKLYRVTGEKKELVGRFDEDIGRYIKETEQ